MKREFILKAMVAGGTLVASLWTGVAFAEERFRTLASAPAEALSRSEMAAVQGKVVGETITLLGVDGLMTSLSGENSNSFTFFSSNGSNGGMGSSRRQNRGQNASSFTAVSFTGPLGALMGENSDLLGMLGLGGSMANGRGQNRISFTFEGSESGVTLKRMSR